MLELTQNPDQVFLRREALAAGYDDRALNRARRSGELVRIRQGAYTAGAIWLEADATERYRLRGRAVARSHGPTVALSHTSAAVEYGVATWNCDYSRVHVTCVDCRVSRTTGDVVYHAGAWSPEDIWQKDDLLITAPDRAAIESALLVPIEPGICLLDSFLHHDLVGLDQLHARHEQFAGWPDARHLRITVPQARVGAQSIGESRTRRLIRVQQLPEPVLQYEVYDMYGNLIGIADFAWPDHGLLGEFDGKVKYLRLRRENETVEQAVIREKNREDRMREATTFQMIRFIWADCNVPVTTGNRLRRMLRIGSMAA